MADIAFIAILKDGQYIHISTRLNSVAEFHIDCHCTALSSLLCFYHSGDSMLRHWQQMGIKVRYLPFYCLWSINEHLSCSSSSSYIVIISFLIYKIVFEISLNICMMFNNIESKHGKLVFSSTDPKGQVRYYHSVSVTSSP